MQVNNYPNWLVPIETAKKLKEIGFDLPTHNTTSIEILESKRYKEENKIYSIENVLKGNLYNANESKKGISIPTWEQVIEWFIDKNLIGTIEYRKFDEKDPYYAYCITNKMTKVLDYSSNTSRYSSYSEAMEALVNKLIELYETK